MRYVSFRIYGSGEIRIGLSLCLSLGFEFEVLYMAEEVIFRIVEGGLTGEEFVFDEKGLCLIGRSADCALQISKEKDMKISRRHCLLILEPPDVRIRDLGSRNGTIVNGELLCPGTISDEPAKMTPVDRILKHGDVITIGETVLTLLVPSAMPVAAPVSKKEFLPQASPPTKVIKLTKSSSTKTGTLIPKSSPVNSGFFPPPPSNVQTTTRTITMAKAISREEVARIRSEKNESPTPPRDLKKDKSKTVDDRPLAPPKPSKAKDLSVTTNKGVPTRIPEAKIVKLSPPAAGKISKKVASHMKTAVMDTKELEAIPDVTPQSEVKKKRKRVTKFKVKGPR